MTNQPPAVTRPARLPLTVEAVFPVVAQQAYVWAAPYPRDRWMDLTFGVLAGLIVVIYTVQRRNLLTRRTFGLASWIDHWRAAGPVLAFTAGAVVALLIGGHLTSGAPHGGLRWDSDIVGALLGYPLWGLVQQALVFGVAFPRLRLAYGGPAAIVASALLFGAAHAPNPLLMFGGAIMVLAYGLVWQRWPALIVVALSHGIIGAVCDKALHVSMRVGAPYFMS